MSNDDDVSAAYVHEFSTNGWAKDELPVSSLCYHVRTGLFSIKESVLNVVKPKLIVHLRRRLSFRLCSETCFLSVNIKWRTSRNNYLRKKGQKRWEIGNQFEKVIRYEKLVVRIVVCKTSVKQTREEKFDRWDERVKNWSDIAANLVHLINYGISWCFKVATRISFVYDIL